jgi:deoxyribonuclease V
VAAVAVQRQLAARVCQQSPAQPIRFVAGLDAAFSPDERCCLSAVVLWDLAEQAVVEQHTGQRRVGFPYIPGLLSFREVPALLAVLRKLRLTPDALLCDGQGLAHPRRFGLACHLGVICELPSIGCAKSLLVGQHGLLAPERGACIPLLDRGEIVGAVLRTRMGVKPVYVSVGHQMVLPAAQRIVLECTLGYRLPEPTRLADRLVAAKKRCWPTPLPF